MCKKGTEKMHIHKAIKLAMEIGRGITRERWEAKGLEMNIIPTNTTSCMIIDCLHSKSPCRRWNPSADDLIADDWELRG